MLNFSHHEFYNPNVDLLPIFGGLLWAKQDEEDDFDEHEIENDFNHVKHDKENDI